MTDNRKAPAERQLGTGLVACFRLGNANGELHRAERDGNTERAVACADAAQAALIWIRAKDLTAHGLRRGVRPEHVRRVTAWHAMQGGQRGPLNALDAWRIAYDASAHALQEAAR